MGYSLKGNDLGKHQSDALTTVFALKNGFHVSAKTFFVQRSDNLLTIRWIMPNMEINTGFTDHFGASESAKCSISVIDFDHTAVQSCDQNRIRDSIESQLQVFFGFEGFCIQTLINHEDECIRP